MKTRTVIEVRGENYEEEQFLLAKFPRTAWIRMGEETRFYVPQEKSEDVRLAITEWEAPRKE